MGMSNHVGYSGRSGLGGAALLTFLIGVAGFMVVRSCNGQSIGGEKKLSVADPGTTQHGRAVFAREGCERCHGAQGEGVTTARSDSASTHIAGTTLALPTFVQAVRKPAGQMPAFDLSQVSDAELSDVYAFLHAAMMAAPTRASGDTVGDSSKGKQIYAAYGCSACHLSLGQGSRATGARIGAPQMPVSAFIRYVRSPTGEMPPYTTKTITGGELTDIYAYLQSVPKPVSWKLIPLLNQ
jgi:mono/diheme cytochrome c family protein